MYIKDALVWLLWFVAIASLVLGGCYMIGHATHEASEQQHEQRMECIDRGGEIRYVTNIGTVCEKDD